MFICSVLNCKRPYFCKSFCKLHYERNRHGRTLVPIPTPPKICFCGKPPVGLGLCSLHYQRLKRNDDVNKERERSTCGLPGCKAPHKGLGLCKNDYEAFRCAQKKAIKKGKVLPLDVWKKHRARVQHAINAARARPKNIIYFSKTSISLLIPGPTPTATTLRPSYPP